MVITKKIISMNKLFVIMNCFPYQNCAQKKQAVYRDYEQCSTSGHRGKHGCRMKIISFVQADGIQKTGVAHQDRGIIVRRDLLLCVTREIICIMCAARGSTSIAPTAPGYVLSATVFGRCVAHSMVQYFCFMFAIQLKTFHFIAMMS